MTELKTKKLRAQNRKGQQKHQERVDADDWGSLRKKMIERRRGEKAREDGKRSRMFSADLRSVLSNARSLGD